MFCDLLRLMRAKKRWVACCMWLVVGLGPGVRGYGAEVGINPAESYQTIAGWGHGGGVLGGTGGPLAMLGPSIADPVNYQYLDYLIDDLGLTGTRVWEVGPRIDGTGNDHGDCDE